MVCFNRYQHKAEGLHIGATCCLLEVHLHHMFSVFDLKTEQIGDESDVNLPLSVKFSYFLNFQI